MGFNKELSDITVVSLEQAVAAPYCGLLLAEAGARVGAGAGGWSWKLEWELE